MLVHVRGMKMKTITRRKIKSKQIKQKLGRGEEENLWRKTKRKQMKQKLGRGEETNLWRWTSQQQKTLF
jgi:hypothetical protein